MKIVFFLDDDKLKSKTREALRGAGQNGWQFEETDATRLDLKKPPGDIFLTTITPLGLQLDAFVRDFPKGPERPRLLVVALGSQVSHDQLLIPLRVADKVIAIAERRPEKTESANLTVCSESEYGASLVRILHELEGAKQQPRPQTAPPTSPEIPVISANWHKNCPHMHEPSEIRDPSDRPAFIHDVPDCQRPIQLCLCKTTNRSLARFCRKCGEPLNFGKAEAQLYAGLPVEEGRLKNAGCVLDLSTLGVSAVNCCRVSDGYIWLGTLSNGGPRVWFTSQGRLPRYVTIPSDIRHDQVVGIERIAANHRKAPWMLVTTKHGVWRLSLAPEPVVAEQPMMRPSAGTEFQFPALWSSGQIFTIESEAATGRCFFHAQNLSPVDVGRDVSPLVLAGERVFFHTSDEIFAASASSRDLVRQSTPHALDPSHAPASADVEHKLYFKGKDGVYVTRTDGTWRPTRIGRKYAQFQFSLSRDGYQIWVHHYDGVQGLDPFGDIQFDSAELHAAWPTAGLPPIELDGKVWIIYYSGRGTRQIGLFDPRSRALAAGESFDEVIAQPMFNLGSMMLVVRMEHRLYLRQYGLI